MRCYTFRSEIPAPMRLGALIRRREPNDHVRDPSRADPDDRRRPSVGLLVSVTEAAANKVLELRSREGKADARLRLFVKSGGCSGFSYGLAFDDRLNEGDRVEDHAGVPVVIDQFSHQHVDGAEIDYVDSLMGSGFAINNPNAVSSCACGSSFNTDGSPAKAGGCATRLLAQL